MKVAAYKSVGVVKFDIGRSELISLLGVPENEGPSRIWAIELRYPAGVYRFNFHDKLREISVDSAELEIDYESVLFENLLGFLKQRDSEIFERVGFKVSPKFGLAFDPSFSSWVTAFPPEELQRWDSAGT